jgi:hypothetical protein
VAAEIAGGDGEEEEEATPAMAAIDVTDRANPLRAV